MTTYSISLDDVDLAFLPLRMHKYNDFLKKENFQFQVMKTETVEDPVPTVYYTCHVCAIEVPASFASQHVASIKHRANVRIASVAMQRTQKLISSLPLPFSEAIHPPSGRFCGNCAIIADEDHDTTKEHRVAAMHDNLLWDLMMAYVGELGDEESKEYYKDNKKSEEYGINKIGDHKKNNMEFENDGNTATVVAIVNKDSPTPVPEFAHNNDRKADKDTFKIIDNNSDIFINDYSNNKNATADATPCHEKKSKPSKQKTVVSNNETVSSKKLEKHNIDEGLSKLDTGKNNDAITKQTELNTGKNKNILDTSKHEDVKKNIRNPNGLKEVNKTETEECTSKHDSKNEVTQSINQHILPTNSQENEALAKKPDEITNKTYLNESSNIVTNEITTRDHIAGYFETKIHSPYEIELARTCNNTDAQFKEVNNQIYIKTYDNVLIIKKDHFHSYKRIYGHNEIICIVCDLVFNDKFERIHTHDTFHRRSVSNIGDDHNYVRRINNIYSHCMLCNIKIPYTMSAVHKHDFYHLSLKDTHIFPIVNGQKQEETFKVGTENDNGMQNKPNDYIIDSKIEYPYQVVLGEIRCVICDCRVPRDLQNRIYHVNGSRHAKNMEKLKTSAPRSSKEPFPWYF